MGCLPLEIDFYLDDALDTLGGLTDRTLATTSGHAFDLKEPALLSIVGHCKASYRT